MTILVRRLMAEAPRTLSADDTVGGDDGDDASVVPGSIATKEAIAVSPDAEVAEAGRLMAEHKVRRLPVTKDGRSVGVIGDAHPRHGSPDQSRRVRMWL